MKLKLYLIVFLLILFFLYMGGCRRAGSWLIKDDGLAHADAMVILMGPIADRVLQAADLYEQKWAGKVIFTEVNVDAYQKLEARGFHLSSNTEQVRDAAFTLGIPSDSILILKSTAFSF